MKYKNGFGKLNGRIEEPGEAGVQIWPRGSESSEEIWKCVRAYAFGRELAGTGDLAIVTHL